MNTEQQPRFMLEIVSDTICPWCYIGKKRVDAALALIGDEIKFDIHWRPFELNPDMPLEGVDRQWYRTRKLGSWEKSLAADARINAAGTEEGLDFHHERMTMTPNTLSSHVLIGLAGDSGLQDVVVEALFDAYFTHGRDIGDASVLIDIATQAGLDPDRVAVALDDDELRGAIKTEARGFAQSGISGVPTVLLNRFILFSGAQAPEAIAEDLRQAAAQNEVIEAGIQAASNA